MEYGVQLYSVRDITQNDMRGALLSIAKQGYSFVEFAGFFGLGADEVSALLREAGLRVSGTHTGLAELKEKTEETIAYHKTIGNKNIYIPWADLSTQEKIDSFIRDVAALQPRFEKEGIRLGYHNHDQEFRPNGDGSVSMEQLFYRTGLALEIDTFWAYAAGVDPVAVLKRFAERIPVIHIKDGFADHKGMPLGQGTAPVKAVYEAALALHIPMVVESETLTPDGLTETGICIKYLRSLE